MMSFKSCFSKLSKERDTPDEPWLPTQLVPQPETSHSEPLSHWKRPRKIPASAPFIEQIQTKQVVCVLGCFHPPQTLASHTAVPSCQRFVLSVLFLAADQRMDHSGSVVSTNYTECKWYRQRVVHHSAGQSCQVPTLCREKNRADIQRRSGKQSFRMSQSVLFFPERGW